MTTIEELSKKQKKLQEQIDKYQLYLDKLNVENNILKQRIYIKKLQENYRQLNLSKKK